MALQRSRLISCALFKHLSFRPQVGAIGRRRYPYNFLQQPSHHLVAKYNILHQYILFKHKTIMADTTSADTKSSGTDKADDSKQPDSSNNKGKNSKQRKAARWKQMNKKKKDRKRANLGLDTNGDAKSKKQKPSLHWTKKYDEDKPVTPHEGSFAHIEMQKKFGVSIDLDDSKEKVEEGVTDDDTKVEAGTDDASTTAVEDETPKIPKRKLAMLVSFKGSNYSGFQININAHTLQAEIELALYRAGVISQRNFGHPGKYSWSNSARTDKGVHAAAQVCSLKGEMITGDDLDAMRMKVNEYMPEDIRVLDFERVTRMFCARTNRDKVRYQYMVPSYLLCSKEEVRKAFDAVIPEEKSQQEGERMTPIVVSNLVEENISSEVLDHARAALINHRVTSEQMDRLKSGLKLFEGTHNFHNYTRRVGANDASSSRYILSFVPLEPIIVPGSTNEDGSKQPDMQWIPLQVVGQSFLLNQIRKMVSAAVDLAREAVSTEIIKQSLTKDHRIKVNVAPAQGLFLDRSFFDLYNKHKANNTPDRVTLDWVEKDGEEMPAAGKS